MEGLCGKNCDTCDWREKLMCPGCQEGPGKAFSGECQVAVCCREKGHETCATCNFLGNGCMKYKGKDDLPAVRVQDAERKQERRKWMHENAPVLGKWLWVLFWLFIPREIGSLMTHDTIAGALPALLAPGQVLTVIVSLAYALVLWKLAAVGKRYRIAAFCTLATVVSAILPLAGVQEQSTAWWLVSLPALAVELVGVYQEFNAHAEVLDGVDDELAGKWRKLWRWNIGLLMGLFGCLLLVLIAGLLGVLVLIAVTIGIVAAAVLNLVYLWRMAKLFREHIPCE